MTKHSSHKWISMEEKGAHGRQLVAGNVNNVFRQIGKSECNIISIFGRARQGKSFLMNCLAGETDIFRISNEKESCTQGIDLSDKWLDLSEFSKIDMGRSVNSNRSLKIGFVDAEGQGDRNVTYDATLVCPILLASKCVLFNWKGDLQKDHILETLGIMTKAAKNVATEASASNSASATKTSKFSHLHIVFRDWQAANSDSNDVYHALFNLERNADSETRDRIRQEVLDSFLSVKVWLFDAPTDSVQALKSKLTIDKTTFIFREQVRELRAALSDQLKTPTLFGGQPVTGKTLPLLITQVVDSLNRGETILPQSAFFNMLRIELDELRHQYELQLKACVATCLKEIPYEKSGYERHQVAPSLTAVLHSFHVKTNEVKLEFENNANMIVYGGTEPISITATASGSNGCSGGSGSGDVTRKVLTDSLTQLTHYASTLEDELQTGYKAVFSKWLIAARQCAEKEVDTSMTRLMNASKVYKTDDELHVLFNEIHDNAMNIIGNNALHSSPNKILNSMSTTKSTTSAAARGSASAAAGAQSEYQDAVAILTRHLEHWQDKVITDNREKRRHNQQILTQLMKDSLQEIETNIHKAAKSLLQSTAHTTGYPRQHLEDHLNTLFEEKLAALLLNAKHTSYVNEIESEFTNACMSLRPVLVDVYAEQRKQAIEQLVQQAQLTIEQQTTATATSFNKEVVIDEASEHKLVTQFNQQVEQTLQRTLQAASGWTLTEEMKTTFISSPIQHTMNAQRVVLMQKIQQHNDIVSQSLAAAVVVTAAKRKREEDERLEDEMERQRILTAASQRLERERELELESMQVDDNDDNNNNDEEEDEEQEEEVKTRSLPRRSTTGTRASTSRPSSSSSAAAAGAGKLSKDEQIRQANEWATSNGINNKKANRKATSSAISKTESKENKAPPTSAGAGTVSVGTAKAQMDKAKEWAVKNKIVIDDDAPEDDDYDDQPATATTTTAAVNKRASSSSATVGSSSSIRRSIDLNNGSVESTTSNDNNTNNNNNTAVTAGAAAASGGGAVDAVANAKARAEKARLERKAAAVALAAAGVKRTATTTKK